MSAGWIVRTSHPRSGPAKTMFLVAIEDGAKALAAVKEFVGSQFTVELGSPVDNAHLVSRGIGAGEIRVLGSGPRRTPIG
jgi:hypothetical protein